MYFDRLDDIVDQYQIWKMFSRLYLCYFLQLILVDPFHNKTNERNRSNKRRLVAGFSND